MRCAPALLILLLPAGCCAAQDPPEYREAARLVQEQRWNDALAAIASLETQYPHNPKVRNLEGLALIGKGDTARAIECLENVLREHPDFSPALKNLTIVEWNSGRVPQAAKHTVEALKLLPGDPVLNAYGAIAALNANQPGAAKQRFHAAGGAISALPPQLESALAALLGKHGLYAESIRAGEDVLKRGFDSPELRYNLALAEFLSGGYPACIRRLEDACARQASSESLNLLAQAYDKAGQTQKAIDTLREATAVAPGDENNYLDLAALCIDHGAYTLGIEVVEAGLKHKPGSARLLFQLGLLYALSGDFGKAEANFERAAAFEPASDLPAAALDLARIQQSRLGAAIDDLRAKVKQQPSSAVLWYLLGSALIRSGAVGSAASEAEAAFRNAIRLDARLPYSYIELGKIYMRQRRIREAVPLLERATRLAPRERAPYYQLALAYRQMGDSGRSAEMLARVKELNQADRANVFKHEVLVRR